MRLAAISQQVTIADVGPWYNGALGELYATLSAQDTALVGESTREQSTRTHCLAMSADRRRSTCRRTHPSTSLAGSKH